MTDDLDAAASTPPPAKARMSAKHVLIGGITAGAILYGCDWVVNNYLLNDLWRHLAQTHDVDMEVMAGRTTFIVSIGVDLVFGLLLAWIYAAIRPRLGPGPSTAVIASLVVYLIAALEFAAFGGWFVPWDMFLRSTVLSLVTFLLAGLVAGKVYQEIDPDAPAPFD